MVNINVCIVIPAYNEEAVIGATVREYQAVFPEAIIVVVDNNSKDRTSEIAKTQLRCGKDLLLFESQQGKGYAVKRGLSRIEADVYIMTDGDLTYPAEDARALYERILSQRADMIVGDRRASGGYDKQNTRRGHSIGNKLLTGLISRLSGRRYNDVLSGLQVMSAPFVEFLDVRSNGFQLETEINLVAAYLRAEVIEEPIFYLARPEGSQSKLSTWRDGRRILEFAVLNWIGFRPMQFFSFLACAGWLVALGLGYRVAVGFLETGSPFSTTAIAGATGGLIGTLSLFTGLTLEIVGQSSRRQETAEFLQRKRCWNARLDAAVV